MSRERELLESCLDEFQYHEVPCPELVIKIKKLLAEREQEPLTNKQKSAEAELEQALKDTIDEERIKQIMINCISFN